MSLNPRRFRFRRWPIAVAAFLMSLIGWAQSANAQTCTDVQCEQWYRWEKELRTTRDYHQVTVGGLPEADNPYRKLMLNVTYTPVSCSVPSGPWCQPFTGFGFWDGGRVFKIRSAFPAGTWQWRVTCAGSSGNGGNCATDGILNQTGQVTVVNQSTTDPQLLERGFVRRSTNSGLRYLTYGDGQANFHWRADTTWRPAITDVNDNTRWNTFLADRKSKNFTVIMMASASSGDDPGIATTVLFEDVPQTGAPCTANVAWPKPCSRWRADYWRKLDEKIRLANQQGFLVVLIGIMDPQGNPQGSTLYPDPAAAAIFARNLAARLSGSHVIFSPSFDDRLSTTRTLMDTVGNALGTAAPRHLLTAHLAGASNICDYYDMHNTAKHPWHQLHIFQSGHALNMSDCVAGEDQYECAMRRARNMPDLLSPTPTVPASCPDPAPTLSTIKPNANGEAAYDSTYGRANPQAVDSPYGVRHSGYNSALNGAFGVTLGVLGIWDWTNITATTLDSDGSKHMKILGDLFNLQPWQMLQRRSSRIKNQPADAEQDQKMTLAATNDSNFAMIYLPDNMEAKLDGSFLTNFDCATTAWSVTWVNPRTGSTLVQGTCQNISEPSGATRKLVRPNCVNPNPNGPLGDCDWTVVLRRSGFYGASASAKAASGGLEVWAGETEEGSGWRILGRRREASSLAAGEPFAISEPVPQDKRMKSPVVSQDMDGKALVVWESEDDSDLHGIFLRRVDGQGRLLDHEHAVNVTTEHDQTNAWAAVSPSGRNAVVTWTSYAQDGDLGGIFARLVNAAGVPFGKEIQVNEHAAGRQDFSKVGMDALGNFVVAWTSQDQDGDQEGVYVRRFDSQGRPLSSELRVNATTLGAQWLTGLEVGPQGDFLVTWTAYAPDGSELGILGRQYDASGSAQGGELLVVPPPAQE